MADSRLEIDALFKRYGDVVALRDMTFDVRAGELFGFVGSNGAGKTTTMRIALGVLSADSGECRWDGKPIDLDTRRHIGYMPEERGLYPKMKVGEQLIYLARLHGLNPRAARRAMQEWLERLGVAARRDDDVLKLSLGNQQRVQLAAALVHDPDILVLDEPFSGLDPVAVDVMSAVLREKCAQGVPCVFSSHQLDLVERLCDRVGIVRSGHMEACGSIEELRSGGTDHLIVVGPPDPRGWAADLPGVTVVEHTADHAADHTADRATHNAERTTLRLEPGTDDQLVLRAALAAGPVREFTRQRQSLTELFRNVVTDHTATEVAA